MKILLVEDDEVFHAVIGRALGKQGHEVVVVANGAEGGAHGSSSFAFALSGINDN